MIRVKCPKCEKKLGVDDSKAGGVAACPECGQKFRIPAARSQAPSAARSSPASAPVAKRRAEQPKAAIPKPAKQPAARPKEDWEHEDSSPYGVQDAVVSKPPKELRQSMFTEVEQDMEMEDFGLDREYVERKKARRRQERAAEIFPGVSYFKAIMFFLLVAWLLVGGLSFYKTVFVFVAFPLGGVAMMGGLVWFFIIAFTDDGAAGALNFIPGYSLYYLVKHWERERRPFFIQLMGSLIVTTAVVALIVVGVRVVNEAATSTPQINNRQEVTPGPSGRPR